MRVSWITLAIKLALLNKDTRRMLRGEIKMDKKKWIVIGMIFAAIILVVLLKVIYCRVEQQSLVLIITAGVLVWYAWETRLMRKEQCLPFISIYFEKYDIKLGTPKDRFLAKSRGKGTAINIEFVTLQPIKGKTPFFKTIEVLPPKEEEELVIDKVYYADDEAVEEGPIARSDFLDHIKKFLNLDNFLFELKYKDILGGDYLTQGSFEESIPDKKWIFKRKKLKSKI